MAMAARDLHALIGRVENDNQPLAARPSAARSVSPSRQPVVRPDRLELDYPTLATRLEPEAKILWASMRHPERACFTPALMADVRHFQAWLKGAFGGVGRHEMPFRHLVWTSQASGAWCMGGDLGTFTRLIRARDERGLREYAYRSVDVIYDNYKALDLPVMTAALIQGDAIGGGFEAMLTNDLVVAERGAKFGLPEVLFGLFPGMGAHSFLRRKVGERMARTLIEDGRSRSADEMRELGLVDIVCEKGEGEAVVLRHAQERAGRFELDLAMARMRRRSDPVTAEELYDIVELWADLALRLGEPELRRMDALARHQERLRARD
jgi:DSF synthase